MALRTKEEYFNNLKRLNTQLYAFGEKVQDFTKHPCLSPPIESIGLVYELSSQKENEDFMTAHSPFINDKVSRFVHIMQDRDDLGMRFRLSRFMVHKHGACIGARCVSTGAVNSVFAGTNEVDKDLGTNYHGRFLEFLKYVQSNDLAVAGAMMDVKGDRSLSPGGQQDPDMYLHIVEKRENGIVVRGAKSSISGAFIADEIIVLPCTALKQGEEDYAVCFAIPSDTPGLLHIAEAPASNARRFTGDEMDYGNAKYGTHGSTHLIFDDVFVPWDRVFLCGESKHAGTYVNYFALLQRLATSGCKTGHRDLLIGAAATVADYNGLGKAKHIRDKLTDFYFQSELSAGCALASVYNAQKSPSGVFFPDSLYINIAKLQGVNAIWNGNYITGDIAGGLVCTVPTAKDLKNDRIGKFVEKYFKAKEGVPTENRIRMMRLIEYLTGQGSVVPMESTHGAGSPQAQKIFIQQSLMQSIDKFKKDAIEMAGIKEKK